MVPVCGLPAAHRSRTNKDLAVGSWQLAIAARSRPAAAMVACSSAALTVLAGHHATAYRCSLFGQWPRAVGVLQLAFAHQGASRDDRVGR